MSSDPIEITEDKIPEIITQYIDKIINKLLDFIKTNINDIGFLEKKLSYLYDNLSNYFSQKISLDIFPKNSPTSLNSYNYNESNNFVENYKISKLKRKLRQQHDIFQIKELAYLERLVLVQNKLQKFELENYKDINKYLSLKNNNNLSTKCILSNNNNNQSLKKNLTKTYENSSKTKKKANIKSASPLSISPLNTIETSSLSNRKKKQNITYNNTFNNFDKNRKKSAKVGNRSVNVFNKISDDITINNYKTIFRFKNKNIKKISDPSDIKHDFYDLKKSVEDGRRKIMFLRNSIAPRLYEKSTVK